MSYRQVMSRFAGDGEKYRASPKGADRGNARRVVKNAVRFVKNPVGYLFWKNPFKKSGISIIWTMMGVTFLAALYRANETAVSHKNLNTFLQRLGSDYEGSGLETRHD